MVTETIIPGFTIREAEPDDIPLLFALIREFAEYVGMAGEVAATEETLRGSLFGNRRVAEVILGFFEGKPACFALFYHNYSSFLGRPGIYLEDLYVTPELRGKGIGSVMLSHIAQIALDRDCGRFEWSVLDWDENAIRFYKTVGAVPLADSTVHRVTGEALEKLARKYCSR